MTEKVDKAWLDIARDAGRQDREGELYLLRAEIERMRATIAYMEDHADAPAIIRREARRALEQKP